MNQILGLSSVAVGDMPPSSLMFKPLGSFGKHQVLFSQGQTAGRLYRVNAGYIKIFQTTENGDESVLDILGEGALIAEWQGLFDSMAQHSYSAISISPKTQISVLDISRLEEIQQQHLRLYIFPHLLQELQKSKERETNMKLKSVGARIVNLLAYFSKNLGRKFIDHVLLDMPLSHLEFAYLSGCSRQTFTSYIGRLEGNRLLRYSRGRILLYPEFFNQIN